MADMGTFRTTIAIENIWNLGRLRELPDTLVDTGSEFTWVPRIVLENLGIAVAGSKRFRLADGSGTESQIDIVSRQLVDAGPIITAAA